MSDERIVILDFDGTLVKENSSRLLEKLLISSINNHLVKKLFMFFFFGKLSSVVDIVFAILSKLYHGDARRYILLNTLFKFKNNINATYTVKEVAKELSLNNQLLKLLKSLKINDNKVVILSLGLDIIIKEFLKINKITNPKLIIMDIYGTHSIVLENYIRIISELTLNDKIKIILNFSEKYPVVFYFTDSVKEVQKIKKCIGNSSSKIILYKI